MSIDRNTANANATTALNALKSQADSNWIANVDAQIATAISLGQFQITALTNSTVDLNAVYQYYSNLGYNISFPDYANQNGNTLPSIINQPQNYFGYNWTAYWQNLIILNIVQNPARITIDWT